MSRKNNKMYISIIFVGIWTKAPVTPIIAGLAVRSATGPV